MEALCQWFYVKNMLLYTHTCPVTEFAVASHLNTANSCCHHVFLRHFRFQKCLPVNRNMSIQNVYVLQKTSYLRAVAAIPLCISEKSRNAARSTTTTLAPAGVEYV